MSSARPPALGLGATTLDCRHTVVPRTGTEHGAFAPGARTNAGAMPETPKQNNHSRSLRMAARGVFPYNTAPVPPLPGAHAVHQFKG